MSISVSAFHYHQSQHNSVRIDIDPYTHYTVHALKNLSIFKEIVMTILTSSGN